MKDDQKETKLKGQIELQGLAERERERERAITERIAPVILNHFGEKLS